METQNNVQESIIDKIIKLQAKGHSAQQGGNLEEAEAFLSKAQELIYKYQIDEAAIRQESGLTPKLVLAKVDIKDKDEAGMPWRATFLNILAKNNFAYTVWMQNDGQSWIWGEKDMVDSVLYLYNNLAHKMYLWAKYAYLADVNDEVTTLTRNAYVKSWLMGAVNGFASKLRKQKEAAEEKNSSLTGLIKTNHALLLQKATERLGRAPVATKQASYDQNTFNKGYAKGKTANANKALGGTNQESGYHKKATKQIG